MGPGANWLCYLLHYAPLSLVLIATLWDHQHSLMAVRICAVYDFKAKTGPVTANLTWLWCSLLTCW